MDNIKNIPGLVYEEGYFTGKEKTQIYYRKYELNNSKGAIVISHGFCESVEKYKELIAIFNDNGFSVYAMDHRGHGKSDRLGRYKNQINVEKFDFYIEDLKLFLDEVVLLELKGEKLYLFAHSMGGAIGSLFLEKYNNYFDAAILNAPMMEVDTGKYPKLVSKIIANLACIFGKGNEYVLGHGPFNNRPNIINSGTSSEVRYLNYFNKQLKHEYLQTSGASYRWLKESFKATDYIVKKENASKVTIPVLLFQAGKDTFVKPEGQNKFALSAPNCKVRLFKEAKHEIYMERDEIFEQYLKEVLSFYYEKLNINCNI